MAPTPAAGSPADADRLRRLREAKLRGLVRGAFGDTAAAAPVLAFPEGAAIVADATAWVLADGAAGRALGRALAFAAGRGATDLHLIVDEADPTGESTRRPQRGVLARRAGLLAGPTTVWTVEGTTLAPVAPAPRPPRGDELPPGSEPFVAMLREAGVDVVVEHGVLLGEILGLEVARVVDGALQVGVGRFDREAAAVVWSDRPTEAALAAVVHHIRRQRHPGATPHPVNRLCRERWLRTQVLADPSVAGLAGATLAPVPPPEPRDNLRDPAPAPALGTDAGGRRVLVVCSVGADLELAPVTADLADRDRPDRVVLVTPARDQLAPQRALAARLGVPHELVAVEGDWPA